MKKMMKKKTEKTKGLAIKKMRMSDLRETGHIRLEVYGINIMGEGCPPVLLLRSADGEYSLPVPLGALEAGITLGQNHPGQDITNPHTGTAEILKSLDLKITKVVFEEIRTQKQFVRLYFRNHPKQDSLLMPAAGVMSLCTQLKIPIFAKKDFISKSQQLVSELHGMAEGLKLTSESLKMNHTYLQ